MRLPFFSLAYRLLLPVLASLAWSCSQAASPSEEAIKASFVYNFTNWFAASVGYKYWYFKYADSGAMVSHLEQTIHGPVLGLQFKY